MGRAVAGGCWFIGVVLAALALNRLLGLEGHVGLVQAEASTGPLWVLAPVLLVAAAWQRRRRLAVLAVALCVGAALWTADSVAIGDAPDPGPGDHLRLVTANLLLDNPTVADAAAAIDRLAPDVVVLQEVTPRVLTELETTALWQRLDHHVVDPREGFDGSAVLSRLPATGGVRQLADTTTLEVSITLASGPLTVVDVHVPAPVRDSGPWRAALGELRDVYGDSSRLLLAGDFNATGDHASYRALADSGLREAWDLAGHGFGATWPNSHSLLPPVLRLDHVLLGRGVAVTAMATHDVPGSDHRAVSVDLVVPDGP